MSERMNGMRWLVETRPDTFDDVGADCVEVVSGGALKFSSGTLGRDVQVIYAPGQWLTVVPGEDESK